MTGEPHRVGHTFPRQIGRYATGRRGPTLLVCGGLHGNEPSGPLAARRVIERLERERPPLRGEVLAFAGNLGALEMDLRYIDHDLNRCWTEERVELLSSAGTRVDSAEDREQRALLALIEEARGRATGPLTLLDLHTTSGKSPPFVLASDTLPNRPLAFAIPAPVILGLEETIDGTLVELMTERGHRAVVVEAGQHSDPLSVELHEAVVWLMLVAAGLLDRAEVPEHERWRRRVRDACAGLPRVVEVGHRHVIDPGDEFRMRSGYRGFSPIEAGEVLARDKSGEIVSPESGLLLMPLYQEQGTDGFFVVRPISRFWLALSSLLRRLRVHGVLPLLPGVRRHAERKRTLCVDTKVARFFPVEILHLFGYRRHHREGDCLVFTRRRPR